MNKAGAQLQSILEECKRHLKRLNYAFDELYPSIPFSAESINKMSDKQIGNLDQYIFRFSKLQDAIGQKLFKSVLLFLGEDTYDKPFIDIFNRLEQLGIIENYETWSGLRLIRNEIAHEYDENKYELAEKINNILNKKMTLEKYLYDILAFLKSRGYFQQFSF